MAEFSPFSKPDQFFTESSEVIQTEEYLRDACNHLGNALAVMLNLRAETSTLLDQLPNRIEILDEDTIPHAQGNIIRLPHTLTALGQAKAMGIMAEEVMHTIHYELNPSFMRNNPPYLQYVRYTPLQMGIAEKILQDAQIEMIGRLGTIKVYEYLQEAGLPSFSPRAIFIESLNSKQKIHQQILEAPQDLRADNYVHAFGYEYAQRLHDQGEITKAKGEKETVSVKQMLCMSPEELLNLMRQQKELGEFIDELVLQLNPYFMRSREYFRLVDSLQY